MRSISRSLLTLAAIAAAPLSAAAQARPEAQGAWGGKTNGAGHYADVNGIKLYYEIQGSGRPLSVALMADDIFALIKHLRLERPDIMGYSLGAGVALQTAIRHPEVVGKLVVVSAIFRRNGFYPDILAQQAQVNAAAAEQMKQTPMYQLYSSIAPRPEDFPRLRGDRMAPVARNRGSPFCRV